MADFGEITELSSPFRSPEVYPTAQVHPRVLLTPALLPKIRSSLTHPENAAMYQKYLELSDVLTDGVLEKTDGKTQHNMNVNILTVIEAKAFRYLMDGDERYGYEAILAIKSFIATLSVPKGVMFDACRAFGYAMYTAALVYDWCYDLLTPEDLAQLTAGVETRLAPRFEMGFPPMLQGGVVGHGTEAQLYRDWLAYAIASYDEYPDIYELVAGRLLATHRDAAEFYMRSGAHWQGGSYGPYRYHYLMFSQILFSRMTGDSYRFFSDDLQRVSYFLLHTIRPDGIDYPMGDGKGTIGYRAAPILLAASFYRDPVLKGFARQYLDGFTVWMNQTFSTLLTPVLFLCLNDPDVPAVDDYTDHMPLVLYNGSPLGQITARSSWKTKDAASVYMKIGEAYSANHEHKDAGHFMIYYKAPLAVDSGVYASHYGCRHDCNYLKQTVAHNCMLVYNPALANEERESFFKFRYSGGQRLGAEAEPYDLPDWMRRTSSRQASVIGAAVEVDTVDGGEVYRHSYLAGDLTRAYDPETVEHASRYMLSVMTEDPRCPMTFFVYDRVTSTDSEFKKTFLLHTMACPEIDHENARACVTFGEGRLHVQSLLARVDYEVIGGFAGETVDGKKNETDRQFWVTDRNYYAEDDPEYKIPETIEAGWGRIEISPTDREKTSRMLHVMYVTDASNVAAPIKATEVESEHFVGAQILGKTVLFPREVRRISESVCFSSRARDGDTEYFIAGLAGGLWSVSIDGSAPMSLSGGESGLLCFRGKCGTVRLSPENESRAPRP